MKGLEEIAKISTHGGKRKGAGRPKAEETKMVRVPIGCLEKVRFIIQLYRSDPDSYGNKDHLLESKKRDFKNLDNQQEPHSNNLLKHELLHKAKRDLHDLPDKTHKDLVKQHGSINKVVHLIVSDEGGLDSLIESNVKYRADLMELATKKFKDLPTWERKKLVNKFGSANKAKRSIAEKL